MGQQKKKRDPFRPVVLLARRASCFPWTILLSTVVLTAASIWITTGLHFTTDLTALLPDDHPDLQILRKIQKKFPAESTYMVLASINYLFATDEQGNLHIHDTPLWHKRSLGRPLYAVWGRSARETYVAGAKGGLWQVKILESPGRTRPKHKQWLQTKLLDTGINKTLRGIWGLPKSKTLYVVGDGGTILGGDPKKGLERFASGTKVSLHAISGSVDAKGGATIIAVGDSGTVLVRDVNQTTWRKEKTGTTAGLLGVWVGHGGAAFAVGEGGILLQRQAGRWKLIKTKTRNTLRSIWGSSISDLYAVGDAGTVLHLEGESITLESSTTTASLRSVIGIDKKCIFAVGHDCERISWLPAQKWFHGPFESRPEKNKGLLARFTSDEPCRASYSAIWRPPNTMKAVLDFIPQLAEKLRQSPMIGRVVYKKPVDFFKTHGMYYLSVEELQNVVDEIEERLDKETAKRTGLYVDLEDHDQGEEGEASSVSSKKDHHRFGQLYKKYGDLAARYGKTATYMHPDGASAGIVVYGKPGATSLGDRRSLHTEIERIVAESGYQSVDPLLQLHVGGDAVNKVREYETTINDILGLAWLAVAGIVLLLLLYFRRLVGLVFVVVPLGMSIVWTFGLTTLVVGQLNIVTGFLFAVLFGLGIDYGLQLFGRYRETRLAGQSMERALDHMVLDTGRATLTSAITSSAAMLTLTITDFRGFSEFGFIAGLGILLAMCSFMLVLPALIQLAERYNLLRLKPASGSLDRSSRSSPKRQKRPIFSIRFKHPIIVLGLLATAFGIYGVFQAQFEYDHSLLRPVGRHDELKDRVNNVFGESLTPTHFLAENQAQLRSGLDAIKRTSKKMGKRSKVRKTFSILDLVPSRQQEKAALLQRLQDVLASKRWNLVSEKKRKQIQLHELRKMAHAKPFGVKDLPASVRRSFRGPGFGDSWIGLVFYRARMSDTRDARLFKNQVGSFAGSPIVNMGLLLGPEATSVVDRQRVEIRCPEDRVQCASLSMRLRELSHEGRKVFDKVMTYEEAIQKKLAIERRQSPDLLALAAEGFIPSASKDRIGKGKRGRKAESRVGEPRSRYLQKAIQSCGPFHVSSHEVVITEVVELMLRDSRIAFGLALGAVFLACLLDFRSLRWTILACLPVSVGLLWIFGVLYLLKMKLNMFNFVMLPVLVGVGIDYGIHYVHRYQEEGTKGLVTVVQSLFWVILFCSATTIVGFGNMTFALHPGLASLGLLAIIGLLAMFVSSSYLLPAILAVRKK